MAGEATIDGQEDPGVNEPSSDARNTTPLAMSLDRPMRGSIIEFRTGPMSASLAIILVSSSPPVLVIRRGGAAAGKGDGLAPFAVLGPDLRPGVRRPARDQGFLVLHPHGFSFSR
jgi:hypothetical protein